MTCGDYGGLKKNGEPCKNRVKEPGRCWIHVEEAKPAPVPEPIPEPQPEPIPEPEPIELKLTADEEKVIVSDLEEFWSIMAKLQPGDPLVHAGWLGPQLQQGADYIGKFLRGEIAVIEPTITPVEPLPTPTPGPAPDPGQPLPPPPVTPTAVITNIVAHNGYVTVQDGSTGEITSRLTELLSGSSVVASSTLINPTLGSKLAGTYSVRLTVNGPGGINSTTQTGIVVSYIAPAVGALVNYGGHPHGKILGPLTPMGPGYYVTEANIDALATVETAGTTPNPFFDHWLSYLLHWAHWQWSNANPSKTTQGSGLITISSANPYKFYGNANTKFLTELGRGDWVIAQDAAGWYRGPRAVASVQSDREGTFVHPSDKVRSGKGYSDQAWKGNDVADVSNALWWRSLEQSTKQPNGSSIGMKFNKGNTWFSQVMFYDVGWTLWGTGWRLFNTDPAEAEKWFTEARRLSQVHVDMLAGNNWAASPHDASMGMAILYAVDEDVRAGTPGHSKHWWHLQDGIRKKAQEWAWRYYDNPGAHFLQGSTRHASYALLNAALVALALPDSYRNAAGTWFHNGAAVRNEFTLKNIQTLVGIGPDVQKSWYRKVQTTPFSNVMNLWKYGGPEYSTQPMFAGLAAEALAFTHRLVENNPTYAAERAEIEQSIIDAAEGVWFSGYAVRKDQLVYISPGVPFSPPTYYRTMPYNLNGERGFNETYWPKGSVTLTAGSNVVSGNADTRFLTEAGFETRQPLYFVKELPGLVSVNGSLIVTGDSQTRFLDDLTPGEMILVFDKRTVTMRWKKAQIESIQSNGQFTLRADAQDIGWTDSGCRYARVLYNLGAGVITATNGSNILSCPTGQFLSEYTAVDYIHLQVAHDDKSPSFVRHRISTVDSNTQITLLNAFTYATRNDVRHSPAYHGEFQIAGKTAENTLTLNMPVKGPIGGNMKPLGGGGWKLERKMSGGGYYEGTGSLFGKMQSRRQPNTLTMGLFGWAYKFSGNPIWLTRGDDVFSSVYGYNWGQGADGYIWEGGDASKDPLINDGKSTGQAYRNAQTYLGLRAGG